MKLPYKIKEAFQWMTPEFKVASKAGKNTIRIKGIAMKSDVISRNKRKYVDEELIKAARTFYEKPVTINHDMNKKVGTVKWMEYENGALEYLADINRQPYVDMLRDGSTEIKGVSIEALYLHNICPKCGDKFYSEEEFQNHMRDVHFIHNFETKEPHGIVGQALSLVLSPEEPGYTGTTIELMEKYQKPVSQLLETVIKTKKEQEEMTKQKETKVPYKIREQEEPPKDEHGCAPDEEWDGEKCAPKKQPEATEQATPAPNVGTQSEGEPEKLACPEGFHLVTDDQGNQKCEPDLPPPPIDKPPAAVETEDDVLPTARPPEGQGATVTVSDQTPCPEGQHRDPETGLCIVDTTIVEPEPNIQMETLKLPPFLKLGEPFAGYTDFNDCVNKNTDKENPEAYCASIKNKVEGETAKATELNKDIYETANQLNKAIAEIKTVSTVRDVKIAEKVNRLTNTVAELYKLYANLTEALNKKDKATLKKIAKQLNIVESVAKVNLLAETKKLNATLIAERKRQDEEFNKLLTIENQLREYFKAQTSNLATSIAETKQALSKVNPKIAADFEATNKRINEIAESLSNFEAINKRIDEVANLATEQKKDFETILAEADKNASALKEQVKSLEDWKAEKEKQVKETAAKQEEANQTAKALKEVVEPLQTEIENLKASLKGFTKQKHPDAIPSPEELDTDNLPYEND